MVCARRVKVLVFAHTPPPHHGQSYMVQLLLEGLRQDPRFEVWHVDARLSAGVEDIGRMRMRKIWRVLGYCAQAVRLRLQTGTKVMYYVPANPSRAALYRDWLVMFWCRAFFTKRVFHWHAAGLGDWLATQAHPFERWLTRRLLRRPALSLVLSEFNRRDAEAVESRRLEVTPNGLPDPCPEFEREILPARLKRLAQRKAGTARVFQVLYIGLCFREKGLFDAVEAVRLANEQSETTVFRLKVAGSFWLQNEQREFQHLCAGRRGRDGLPQVEYLGFVSGETKERLFRESDCLCFPTYYSAESFGLVIVEALARGLPVVTTRWRMIPEVLPMGYPALVEPKSPEQIAGKLVDAIQWDFFASLREHYVRNFTADEFLRKVKAALLSL